MWLYHNHVLQISGSFENAEAELRKILCFFEIEKPEYSKVDGWRIDGDGRLAFRYRPNYMCGDQPARGWFPVAQPSGRPLIRKILDYLSECAERSPALQNGGFLLRWIPQGGYDRVNRICGAMELEDYGWDGGFTVEPWSGWKGRVFRFSCSLAQEMDEILVFAQKYLGLALNGEIYPMPDGGFALGKYSREELRKNPLLTDNAAEREMICRQMRKVLPGQQEINGTFCDEESHGFMLDYVSGQMEEQDKLLVLPYVCFCHK